MTRRRLTRLLGFTLVAGATVLAPSGAVFADDASQAMEAHMAAWDRGVPGMEKMMDGQSSVACMNMMEAPPFGGDSPHE